MNIRGLTRMALIQALFRTMKAEARQVCEHVGAWVCGCVSRRIPIYGRCGMNIASLVIAK